MIACKRFDVMMMMILSWDAVQRQWARGATVERTVVVSGTMAVCKNESGLAYVHAHMVWKLCHGGAEVCGCVPCRLLSRTREEKLRAATGLLMIKRSVHDTAIFTQSTQSIHTAAHSPRMHRQQ